MLHAFRNFEKAEKETIYHGTSGFLEIRPAQSDEVVEAMKVAAKERNVPWYDDLNAEYQLGIGYVWANVYSNYKRCGAYQAFVKPNLTRENLTLLSGVQYLALALQNEKSSFVEGQYCPLGS